MYTEKHCVEKPNNNNNYNVSNTGSLIVTNVPQDASKLNDNFLYNHFFINLEL